MRRLLLIVVALLVGVVMAVPAAAIPTTGNQVYLWSTTYLDEGEPFFISEGGWTQTSCPPVSTPSEFDFDLEIDGVSQKGFRTLGTYTSQDFGLDPGAKWIPCYDENWNLTWRSGVLMWVSQVFNFPTGLPAGEYTFSGHWTFPDGGTQTISTQVVVSPAP